MAAAGMIAGAAIGAGAGASMQGMQMIGQTAGANVSYSRQKKMIRQQQGWQEYMRSTAYQTAVDDLRKAGLNPILAAQGMGPAQAPPGQGIPSQGVGPTGGGSDVMGAAKIGALLKQEHKKKKGEAQSADVRAWVDKVTKQMQAGAIYEDWQLKGALKGTQQELWSIAEKNLISAGAQAHVMENRARMSDFELELTRLGMEKARTSAKYYATDWAKWMRFVKETREALGIGSVSGHVGAGTYRSQSQRLPMKWR